MGSWDQVHRLGQEFVPERPLPPKGKIGDPGGAPARLAPENIRTPQEALAYIKHLYRLGRMADLAGLLRRRPVFREVWLAIQCFPQLLGEAGQSQSAPDPTPVTPTRDKTGPPFPSHRPSSGPFPEAPRISHGKPFSPPRPGGAFQALSAYGRLEHYFSKERNRHPLIDLRV